MSGGLLDQAAAGGGEDEGVGGGLLALPSPSRRPDRRDGRRRQLAHRQDGGDLLALRQLHEVHDGLAARRAPGLRDLVDLLPVDLAPCRRRRRGRRASTRRRAA